MADRGCYMDLTTLKRAIVITDTRDDTRLLELIEYASRQVDSETGRVFYVKTEARYFTARHADSLVVPDLLTITAIATDDGTRAYATSWAATDYELEPVNDWPKWEIVTAPEGDYSFPTGSRGVKVTGTWGYGDGTQAAPWLALATTATVATTSGTTITTSAGTGLAVGQTWLVESEQMYVTAGSGTSWTAERGVNGTTAATHTTKAISLAQYPKQIVEACRMRVEMEHTIPISGSSGGSDIGTVTADGRSFARYMGIINTFKLWGVG